jgi:Uma2 family endonuclease
MTALVIPTDSPTVQGPPQGHWAYADWERLPEDGNRYEIIDGVLYMSTAPSFFHQWIILQFVRQIGTPALEQGLAVPIFAPIGVLMPGCDPVQPDFLIVLFARTSIIHDRRIRGVPDAIVETLSPSNRSYDEDVKRDAYARAGLSEYVIVDPAERRLRHYRLAQPGQYAEPEIYGEHDAFGFDCLPALPLHVGDLFAGSPDTTL